MKKMFLLMMLYMNCIDSFAQNVGIGITTPLAPLHIKNNNEALRLQGNTTYLSFANNAGILKGFLQSFNNDLYLGTPSSNATGNLQFYAANIPAITIKPTADVIVGSDASNSYGKFTVQTLNNSNGISHLGEGGNILATRMGGTSAGIGTFSNTNMRIFSNSFSRIFINASNGYVGLGGDFPLNKLQIGTIPGSAGSQYIDNDLAIGNGTNSMRIGQYSDVTYIASDNTDIVLLPKEGGGNVGINTISLPTNKLQIGSVGNTGFAGNNLAIGNGTTAMAIYQTNISTLIGSTTDIILKPQNNGRGRVGINTNTPRAPLDVAYTASVNRIPGLGYSYLNVNSDVFGVGHANDNPVPLVSIVTDGRVLSTEFDAYSDARIKNIIGISNSSKDLETIDVLQITDYTFKDKIKNGNKSYKKVIAQQVEKFYPQVVSKHTDFVPNVYQLASKVEKTVNGYLISFTSKHNISPSAKKLQILLSEGKSMDQFDIVSIPSDRQVIINATDIKSDKVFVYGEEVDDFRTVDYEGLTTLNISATQELSKLIKIQNKKISELEKEIKLLKTLANVQFKNNRALN